MVVSLLAKPERAMQPQPQHRTPTCGDTSPSWLTRQRKRIFFLCVRRLKIHGEKDSIRFDSRVEFESNDSNRQTRLVGKGPREPGGQPRLAREVCAFLLASPASTSSSFILSLTIPKNEPVQTRTIQNYSTISQAIQAKPITTVRP